MAYKTINISLPEKLKNKVETEVRIGDFASTSDFVRDLLRKYFEEKRIESLIIEGLRDQNISQVRKADFDALKSEILQQHPHDESYENKPRRKRYR